MGQSGVSRGMQDVEQTKERKAKSAIGKARSE